MHDKLAILNLQRAFFAKVAETRITCKNNIYAFPLHLFDKVESNSPNSVAIRFPALTL